MYRLELLMSRNHGGQLKLKVSEENQLLKLPVMNSSLNLTDTTLSENLINQNTSLLSVGEFMRDKVTVWVQLSIVILGLFTNPLVLIVLCRKRFGSKYTKQIIVYFDFAYF